MSKKSIAKALLSSDEINQKIRNTVGFWRVQKWLIIHNALNHPRSSKEIADHLAVSKSLVNKTISEYNRYGASSIETKGKGGRWHSYLTAEDERKFMDRFIASAHNGSLATVAQIKEEYERLIGKTVHKTTIYRLLKRNAWRKVVPRPHHPQRNKEAQETFKKTSINK